jgi:hypothetical protein
MVDLVELVVRRDRGALRRGPLNAQALLPARKVRLFTAAAVLTAAIYFPLAYYLSVTYARDVPLRDDVAEIHDMLNTGTPGIIYAHLWLPDRATEASIYEGGVLIGEASRVYNDPVWTFTSKDGVKRWKYVEFKSQIDVNRTRVDPNRKRYWIVFR